MKLTIQNNSSEIFDLSIFEQINIIIEENENINEDDQVSLLITSSDEIKQLNKKYRGKNTKTDVLSFPINLPFANILGDIIIDIEVAKLQKGNRTLEEELKYLYLHGLLHLLGYDHLAKKDADIMENKEKYYWEIIGGNE